MQQGFLSLISLYCIIFTSVLNCTPKSFCSQFLLMKKQEPRYAPFCFASTVFFIFNRPCVDGAVLQTPPSLFNSLTESPFSSKPSKHHYTQTLRARELNFERMFTLNNVSLVKCHVSDVRCQMSGVRCQVSGVTSFVCKKKVGQRG